MTSDLPRLVAILAGLAALGLVPVPIVGLGAAAALVLASPWLRRPLGGLPYGLMTMVAMAATGAAALPGHGFVALGGLLAWLAVHRALVRQGPADDRVAVLIAATMLVLAGTATTDAALGVCVLAWAAATPLALLAEGPRQHAGRHEAGPYGPDPGAGRSVGRGPVSSSSAGGAVRSVGRDPGSSASAVGARRSVGAGLVPARNPAGRSSLRAVGLVGAVAAVAAVVFLAAPRLGEVPTDAAGPSLTGFRSEVALGDLMALWEDPTPVARVRVEGPVEEPLFLRGAVLDTFDGRSWTATSERVPFGTTTGGEAPDLRVEVIEESVVENVLLVVGEPVRVEGDGVVAVIDADGTLWAERPDTPIRYVVHARSTPSAAPLDEADRRRLVALPDLDPRVLDLAAGLAPADADAGAVIEEVRGAFAGYVYTRTARDRDDEDPLAAFLFDRRRGHCEYFASAAAVLLRTRGVPARLVTGFAGGERTAEGWRFRRAHAHAWVEVHDGTGWRVLDATPGPRPPRPPAVALQVRDAVRTLWSERIVGYDRGAQVAVVTGLGRGVERLIGVPATPMPPWLGWTLLGGVLVAGTAGAGLAARGLLARLAGERLPAPKGRVAAAHARAWRDLSRKGWSVPPDLPPVAAARFVRERAGDAAAPLERLAWLHYAVRYGGADDAALAGEATACASESAAIPGPRSVGLAASRMS